MSIKDFQIISRLGEGTYSSVWLVKRLSDGQEYAMKKVKLASLSEKEKQNSLNEVRLLASIDNEYIISFKEVFFEDSHTLCIVMEHAGGGDIYEEIVKHKKSQTYFEEKDVWRYSLQMILGLKALHDRKILHRDIKCANIFLSQDGRTTKLGDLNVSKVAKDELVYTQTGTPYYASPEVWRDQPYDSKSDVWSLGCVIYEICALNPPFRAKDMPELYKKVQKGAYEKIPSQYSPELRTLISLCLQVSPSKRLSCDQLLEHPVIKKKCQGLIYDVEERSGTNELLATIRLPKNLKNMKSLELKLPKRNYAKHSKSISINDYPYSKHMDPSDPLFSLPDAASIMVTEKDSQKSSVRRSITKETDKNIEELFNDAVQNDYETHIQKMNINDVKKSRKSEITKANMQRIVESPKVSNLNIRERRAKVSVAMGAKEGKSVELVRNVKPDLAQRYAYEANERIKTIENRERNNNRHYLLRRDILREGEANSNLTSIVENSHARERRANSNINNAGGRVRNLGVVERVNLLEKSHEDRLDAMERKAQQLIRKYQQDLNVIMKSEGPSKRETPDLRDMLERKIQIDHMGLNELESYERVNRIAPRKLGRVHKSRDYGNDIYSRE